MHIVIIGAGAAGCFAAIEIKRNRPEWQVTVAERGRKALAKVAVTGGGRCNLTNSFAQVRSIASVYPRGERLMKRLFKTFDQKKAMEWFEREGVRLVTQDDECVFPLSQDAMEIVRTLLYRMKGLGVRLLTGCRVTDVSHSDGEPFTVVCADGMQLQADRILVTTGGSPLPGGLDFLRSFHLDTVFPVPSLFSFQIDHPDLTRLMGTVVGTVTAGLAGTRLKATGTLLVTHWGVSGPAILRLSSYAARHLHDTSYQATLCINWTGGGNETETMEMLRRLAADNPQRQVGTIRPEALNTRLWQYLVRRAGLPSDLRWRDMNQKQYNRMVSVLTNDTYPIANRCRHKEEFVTCGGVALGNVDPHTLECRQHPGLYFAGEVLDVDAVTGGFNLQAAWTMAYVAAQAITLREGSGRQTEEKKDEGKETT